MGGYTLRLILRAGGREFHRFERDFKSWADLSKAKDRLKNKIYVTWNSGEKAWERCDECFLDETKEKIAKLIADIFGLDANKVLQVIERYNKEVRRLVNEHNEKVRKKYRGEVKGKLTIIPLPLKDEYGDVQRLPDEGFRHLKEWMEWNSSKRVFEFNEKKFLRGLDLMKIKSKGDVRELAEEFLNVVKGEYGDLVALDEEAWRTVGVERLWNYLINLKKVRAELVELENNKNGRKRTWVKLTFNPEVYMKPIREKLFEIREIPYNIQVFEEGEVRFKEITIYGVLFDKENRNVVFTAPFLFYDVRRMLEESGFMVEGNIPEPSVGGRKVEVEDIEDRLRPYQREALQKWIEAGYKGSIQMPTGAGKTWIGLAGIGKLKLPTVVFVPTINLAIQWKEKIAEVLKIPEDQVGILGGGYHELGKPILVCVYDSGVNYRDEIARQYTLYIYDEGHHVGAKTFKEIAWSCLTPYRMVLSATIERDDANEEMIYKMTGDKVYEITFYELVKAGYLAPVRVEFIEVEFPEDERKKYEKLDEELTKVREEIRKLYTRYSLEAMEEGYTSIGDYLRKTKNPEYTELNRRATSLRSRMRVLEQANEKQANKIYSKLRAKYGEKVGLVIGKTSTEERDRLFKLFKEGKIQCIVTTTVLDEGIDAPVSDVAIVVSSRAIRHPRQFVQRIGRVVRPLPGKVAKIYILRTVGVNGAEERTLEGLKEELDRVYEFTKMEKLIENMEREK